MDFFQNKYSQYVDNCICSQNYNDAIKTLFEKLQEHPKSTDILNRLAFCYLNLNQIEKAEDYLHQSLSINPQSTETLNLFGKLYNLQKLFSKSSDFLLKSMKINDKNVTTLLLTGENLRNMGRFEQALKCFQHVLKIDPDNFHGLFNLAVVCHDNSLLEEAKEFYEHCLKIHPHMDLIHYHLSQLYEEDKNLPQALKHIEKAIKKNSQNPDYHIQKAMLAFKNLDFDCYAEEYHFRFNKVHNLKILSENNTFLSYKQLSSNSNDIFIACEQGLGDEIQFAQALQYFHNHKKNIVLEAPYKLFKIYRDSFPDFTIIPKDSLSFRELQEKYNIKNQTTTGEIFSYYVSSFCNLPAKDQEKWLTINHVDLNKSSSSNNLKIGISWRSILPHSYIDNIKRLKTSTQLMEWEEFIADTPADFFSLQYGNVKNELVTFNNRQNKSKILIPDIDLSNDLYSTANFINSLDIVVSTNTTVAFLAAALGKKVYFLADSSFCQQNAHFSLKYYPNMLFFQQNLTGDWQSVLKNITIHIKEHVISK